MVLALGLVCGSAFAASLAGFIWSSSRETVVVPAAYVDYDYDALGVSEGHYLFSIGCARCHIDRNGALGPQEYRSLPAWFGRIYTPNLSRDPLFGNSEWTDEDLWRVLAHDADRQSLRLPAAMPAYREMDEDDIGRLVAFLRLNDQLARPVTVATPASEYSLAGQMLSYVVKPGGSAGRTPGIRGQYLADVVAGCSECHSSRRARMSGAHDYAGTSYVWSGSGDWIRAPSLRGRGSVIGLYDPEQLAQLLRQGRTVDGAYVEMPLYPELTTADAQAIWAYLDSLDGSLAQRGSLPDGAGLGRARLARAQDCRHCHSPVPAQGTTEYRAAHGPDRRSGSYASYRSPILPASEP